MNSSIRNEILFFSLLAESSINSVIAHCMGIEDVSKSRSFNHKSTALSYAQKLNLLLDINIVQAADYWKFQTFMEIRNKFMHVMEIDSYVKCFQYVERAKLLQTYPAKPGLSEEDKLHSATISLAFEVIHLCRIAFEKLLCKVVEHVRERVDIAAAKAHSETLKELSKDNAEDINLDEYWKLFEENLYKNSNHLVSDNYRYNPFEPSTLRISINFVGEKATGS